jgi:Acetyltransferase (GNAT) domain
MKTKLKLLRVSDSKKIDADVLDLSDKHLADFDTFWLPRLHDSEEDSHWDWRKKSLFLSTLNYEKHALECENITQGLMILEIDYHHSRLEPGKNLVYVDYLATAPWNRPSIQDPPMYRGVGTALLMFAIKRSFDLEYKGRVGLHALPLAEKFYKKIGLVDFGADAEKQGLSYFELSVNEALKIISIK